MQVNSNEISLAQYKGEIKPCPLCFGRTPGAALDALTSGRACKLCLDKKFVAVCTNCAGIGQYKGKSVWDGGRSDHTSTCSACGGSGVFPTSKPKDWIAPVPESAPIPAA